MDVYPRLYCRGDSHCSMALCCRDRLSDFVIDNFPPIAISAIIAVLVIAAAGGPL